MNEHNTSSLAIGMVHFKTGDTDGVSLEMDKWKQVFTEAGHRVFFCCAERPNEVDAPFCTLLLSLSYLSEKTRKIEKGMFGSLEAYGNEEAFQKDLYADAKTIEQELVLWIKSCHLDVLIVENLWSVALHPSASIALLHAIEQCSVQVLAHHHDFYWERVVPVSLTCKTALEVADCFLPPHTKEFSHVVINTKAQKALQLRKGIDADVIPNVFDFSQGPWEVDSFNADFRTSFGIKQDDVLLLQATRVIPRKGIELAIDFANELQEKLKACRGKTLYHGKVVSKTSNVVLVLSGSIVNDTSGYLDRLQKKAHENGVKLLWIGYQVASQRSLHEGKKTYSLWDAYAHADLVTYPSYWEGWGNQLLEAIRAKLPVVLFEYEIYRSDIAPSGMSMISLGDTLHSCGEDGLVQIDQNILSKAADKAVDVLFDAQKRRDMVELNFAIAKKEFSLDTLRAMLEPYWVQWSKNIWSH